MATPKNGLRPGGARKPQSRKARGPGRPWQALLLMGVLVAVLVGGMFASGYTTPRLGIDLAGGTSITLTAEDDEGNQGAVNQTNLDTAASIIERRVNGMGVSEAEVQTQGDRNIVVNIPQGADEQQAREQVGTTAQLGFRPVIAVEPVQPAPPPTEGEGDEGEPGEQEEAPGGEDAEGTDGQGDGDAADADQGDQGDDAGADEGADGEGTNGDGTQDQSLAPLGSAAGATTATHASLPAQDADETPPPDEEGQQEEPGAGEESGAPEDDTMAQLAALDCSTEAARLEASQAAGRAQNEQPVVACDGEGALKYALGPVAVPGTDVSGADSVYDPQQGWIVQMEFTNQGASRFADITAELAGQLEPQNQFAITLDGEVVSAPRVSERLGGGSATISGNFDDESSEELANILQYGALPITFEEGNVSTVSPLLGGEQLRSGLIAGAIGLGLVALYLAFYYRGLALVALASLVATGGITYAVMALLGPAIGFTLSLPAICGAIVAIGITADSFIVYFERVKDEVREGRSMRGAIERAWPRARRTILISDFVSFLAAVVLFILSIGTVQGFAFTLGLTTAVEVVVVFLLTRPLMTLLARSKAAVKSSPWTGLDPRRLAPQSQHGKLSGLRRTPAVARDAKGT